MAEELLDGMDVRTCIEQMGGEGMPECMCGECMLFESRLLHGHADGVLYGTVVHGPARCLSLEKELFGPVNLIICFQQWKYGSGQDCEPVPASLSGHYL